MCLAGTWLWVSLVAKFLRITPVCVPSTQLLPQELPAFTRGGVGKGARGTSLSFFEMEGDLVPWRECGPIFPQLLGGLGPLDNLRLSLEVKSIARERKDGVGLNMASTAATWWRKEARRLLLQFPEGGGRTLLGLGAEAQVRRVHTHRLPRLPLASWPGTWAFTCFGSEPPQVLSDTSPPEPSRMPSEQISGQRWPVWPSLY